MEATKYVEYRAAAVAVEESTQSRERKWVKRSNLSPTMYLYMFCICICICICGGENTRVGAAKREGEVGQKN